MPAAHILDDLAKMAGGTISLASSVRNGVKDEVKSRIDDMAERFDLVPRSEFERAMTMLQEARIKQSELEKRLDALEKNVKSKKAKKS